MGDMLSSGGCKECDRPGDIRGGGPGSGTQGMVLGVTGLKL